MNPHPFIDFCMGFICVLWLVEHLVSMTRKSAPKRNRKLLKPSHHCDRIGSW